MQRTFKQVDVFTRKPFLGNPVAVVFDADDLDESQMQAIARWTNLSETTFVLSSGVADYRLRIFTPERELTFAGHPTLGSAYALLESGRIQPKASRFTQECGIGIVELRVCEQEVSVVLPIPKRLTNAPSLEELHLAIGSPAEAPIGFDIGARWLVATVPSREALRAIAIDSALTTELSLRYDLTGITLYAHDGEVFVRSFAPACGVLEDPVCGSGNACVAAHILATGMVGTIGKNYIAHQGENMGRRGTIHVELDSQQLSIGGPAVTVIEGCIHVI